MKTRALLLALPVLALSCRDGTQSIEIQQICFPPDDCVFTTRCDQTLMGNPAIDLTGGDGSLTLFLQVANRLTDNSDKGTYRSNTNDAHVDEIRVEYETVPVSVVSFTNQRVGTNGTNVIEVPAAPAGFDAYFAGSGGQALGKVTMRGYLEDGSRFETAEFPLAVDMCWGCARDCAAGQLVCGGNEGQEPKACIDPDGATTP